MMKISRIATLLIATCAVSTGAMAQKTIYRCGSSYSQVPCEGAVSVDAQDARTRADKAAADKATQRDMKQANAMEKTRVKEEKDAISQAQAAAKTSAKASAKPPEKSDASEGDKKQSNKPKKKEPEFFTAKAGAEKKKD